jgi:hypothetical protein
MNEFNYPASYVLVTLPSEGRNRDELVPLHSKNSQTCQQIIALQENKCCIAEIYKVLCDKLGTSLYPEQGREHSE